VLGVNRQFGAEAAKFVAALVKALAINGEEAGVMLWLAIADCLYVLKAGGTIQ